MVAIDHLLLAEHLELAGGEVVRPLQRPRRAEGPARPARALQPNKSRSSQPKSTNYAIDRIGERNHGGRAAPDLVLDGSDGAVFTPVEVGREAVGGEDGRLVRGRPLEQVPGGGAAEAEELAAELGRGEVGELGDPVRRRGVEPLVAPRAAEVGPEHGHAARALVLIAVRLAEPADEAGEVRLRVQLQLVAVRAGPDHLLDERVLRGGGGLLGLRRAERGGGEEGEEEERGAGEGAEAAASHGGDWPGPVGWDIFWRLWCGSGLLVIRLGVLFMFELGCGVCLRVCRVGCGYRETIAIDEFCVV